MDRLLKRKVDETAALAVCTEAKLWGVGHVAPPPLGDLGKGSVPPKPPVAFDISFLGVYGMTFEGKVRKLSDRFHIKLVWGG